jgi:hypothetical protein
MAMIPRSARCYDHPAIAGGRERRDAGLDFCNVLHSERREFYPKRLRHRLDCGELADTRRRRGIAKDRHTRDARRNLLEQLHPFPGRGVFEIREARCIAARPRQASDEAGSNRIRYIRENDRNGSGRL